MKPLTVFATLLGFVAVTAGARAETPASVSTTVSRIKSGERVVTSTKDGATLTGPFFLEGAEPGDLIVVSIDKLEPNRTTGMSPSFMAPISFDPGALANKAVSAVPWTIDKAKGVVRLDLQAVIPNVKWLERYTSTMYELPLRPMLSSIGVAPKDAAAAPAGPFGGGFDYAGITSGVNANRWLTRFAVQQIVLQAMEDMKLDAMITPTGNIPPYVLGHLTGDYSASGKTPTLRMKLVGQQMPATDLQAALPAVGVTLPSGSSLKQGTIDADLTILGPVDRLVIAGSVGLAKGTLAGFDLGAKLGALGSFAGVPAGGDTVIETLTTKLRVAPEGIQADALNMVAPAIGTLTGGGTIAPAGAMNFKMLAKLRGGAAPAAVPGGVGRIVAFSQSNGIPFRIEGTTSAPLFRPDLDAAVAGMKSSVADIAKDPEKMKQAAGLLGGLFGKK